MTATKPWSPIEIEVRIRNVIELREEAVLEAKALAEKAGEAKRKFRVAEAQAMLRARRDMPREEGDKAPIEAEKKAWVLLECADLEEAYEQADVIYKSQQEVIKQLHDEGELLRTLARSSRDLQDTFGGRS